MWRDTRLLDLFGVEHPIVQAQMAGSSTPDLAVAVAESGALGSLACALLTPEGVRDAVAAIRGSTRRPLNLNFFCHVSTNPDPEVDARWRARLRPYAVELGLGEDADVATATRTPFDSGMCEIVEELRPEVVSFHFGLPDESLLRRVRASGARILSSATTVAEAVWLEARGVDAVIAQGAEAGGHRGMFLTTAVAEQPGAFALVPQVVDAVRVPVVAAGGIADERGIAAALALGAAGVQIGTAYLFCPECRISAPHRAALSAGRDDGTALTNVFTGRPARGLVNRAVRELGPLPAEAPPFPLAATALAPIRQAAEAKGLGDFSPLWAGQAVGLGREGGAAELTRALVRETRERLGALADRDAVRASDAS